ncbi:hypothetical protein BH23CHL2_BH23CHL2_26840 [soil metagenome]
MASSPFERQVVESDATDERSSVASGTSDAPKQFEPSPSFLDYDRPNVRLVELPAWLQSFAASLGEPSESEISAKPVEEDPLGQPVDTSEDRPDPDTEVEPTSQPSASPGVSSGFISEDDLPEWLRSIAPEESGQGSTESFTFERSGGNDQLAVPNVSRAWSTSKDARGPDESTTLFALVASQTPHTALPDGELESSMVQQGVAPSSRGGSANVERYGGDAPPGKGSIIDLSGTANAETAAPATKPRRPLMPIIIAAILLLMLIGTAAVNFLM